MADKEWRLWLLRGNKYTHTDHFLKKDSNWVVDLEVYKIMVWSLITTVRTSSRRKIILTKKKLHIWTFLKWTSLQFSEYPQSLTYDVFDSEIPLEILSCLTFIWYFTFANNFSVLQSVVILTITIWVGIMIILSFQMRKYVS